MSGRKTDTAILVFARAPVAGAVKTRLIPLLGAAGAATLHRRLLGHALATAQRAGNSLALWGTPDSSDPVLQDMAAQYGAAMQQQQGADLGARMAHAFAATLAQTAQALCIGADCPALTANHLHQAAAALREGSDAVFVPAEDGGYALVGLRRHIPQLFAGIDWGTATVMAQTRSRLQALHLRWQELETLWDVDRPADYQRLQQSGLLDAPA